MDIDKQIRAVFDIIMEYTQEPEHDRAVAKRMKEIRAEWDDKRQILLAITGTLYDGLAYGNWPWVK